MNYTATKIDGVYAVATKAISDHRGQFARLFCHDTLRDIDGDRIEQVNSSVTMCKGAVRGMHFQRPPKAEGKWVRCLRGAVFDVAVDVRQDSPTYLQWHGEILSAANLRMLHIPKGVAHGFQTLEPDCTMLYLHTEFYSPAHEDGLRHDDPSLGIEWPLPVTDISDRDRRHRLVTEGFAGLQL